MTDVWKPLEEALQDTVVEFPQRRVTRDKVLEHLARSMTAAQVTLPIEIWRAHLEELLAAWDEIALLKARKP